MFQVFYCFLIFFVSSFSFAMGTSKDDQSETFDFVEIFYLLEMNYTKDIVLLPKDVFSNGFYEYNYLDYIILKHKLWNHKSLKKLITNYHKEKELIYLDKANWENLLKKVANFEYPDDWDEKYYLLLKEARYEFFNFIKENYPSVFNPIYNTFNEMKYFSVYDSLPDKIKNFKNSFGIIDDEKYKKEFYIPIFLLDSINKRLWQLSEFKAKNYDDYQNHLLKFWVRFFFKQFYTQFNVKF